jgi:hypothetical protein
VQDIRKIYVPCLDRKNRSHSDVCVYCYCRSGHLTEGKWLGGGGHCRVALERGVERVGERPLAGR